MAVMDGRCFCGALGDVPVVGGTGMEWRCARHAPWACASGSCAPDSDEDAYPAACDFQSEDEES